MSTEMQAGGSPSSGAPRHCSEKTEELHAAILDCLRADEQWIAAPPTDRGESALMRRVLELHVEVTKLERGALLAVVKGSTAAPAGCSAG
jgi:hypothetical protein